MERDVGVIPTGLSAEEAEKMEGRDEMTDQNGGKGFHPLYLWSIFYVLLTYAYPVLWYFTLPHVDESVSSGAAYEEAAKAQNGALGSDLPFVFLAIPVLLLVINLILSITMKQTERRVLLNAVRIMKYALIPFYVVGGIIIAVLVILTFSPVVFMIFIGPIVIAVLVAMGWVSMVGSAPFMISYLKKTHREGRNGKPFTVVMTILQFFLGLDVVGTIICALKEKHVKRDGSF